MARIVVGPRCEYNNFLESKSPATAGSHALARIVNLPAYPARASTPVAHVRRFWADVRPLMLLRLTPQKAAGRQARRCKLHRQKSPCHWIA